MDGRDILSCISSHKALQRSFGVILASDDVRRICDIPIWRQNIQNYNNNNNEDYGSKFFEWITNLMNEHKSFPIGFILNTGTHQNGGQHWQALYFDANGISYFFDSYGREAKVEFKRFEMLIRAMYHFLQNYGFQVEDAFKNSTIENFINLGLIKAIRETQNTNKIDPSCVRYWDHQIQDDNTNVCGQYSTFFLYNLTSSIRNPSLEAYKFFADNFYYFNSLSEKNNVNKETQSRVYKMNDRKMALLFQQAFGYVDKNIVH